MKEIFDKLEEDIHILIKNARRDCEELMEVPPPLPPIIEIPKYKWGIIVPHTMKAQGAESPSKLSEYEYGLDLVKKLPIDTPYSTRDDGGVYGAAINLKRLGCNASLEPHKNAYNGRVSGTEFLVMRGDTKSESEAKKIIEKFKIIFPSRRLRHDGGIKFLDKGDRGYNNLYMAKEAGMEVAIISEVFFIDNPSDFIEPSIMANFWKGVLFGGDK